MKTFFTCLSLLFLFSQLVAKENKNTASYLLGHAYENIGEKVTIEVLYVTPHLKGEEAEAGIRLLNAHTWDKNAKVYSGEMLIVATVEEADSLVKKYGSTVRPNKTKKLRAPLRVFYDNNDKKQIPLLDLTPEGFWEKNILPYVEKEGSYFVGKDGKKIIRATTGI